MDAVGLNMMMDVVKKMDNGKRSEKNFFFINKN